MKAQDNVKEGDTLIFFCTPYQGGRRSEYDGTVIFIGDGGAEVGYMKGYKYLTDFISWKDIVAKVSKDSPYVSIKDVSFSGHFEIFEGYSEKESA